MRDKIRFALTAAAISLVLYLALYWAYADRLSSEDALGFLVPAVAVILAARGVAMGRRVAWALGAVGVFVLLILVARWLGIAGATAVDLDFRARPAVSAAVLAYGWMALVYPVFVLILFVGRRPAVLWTPPQAPPDKR